MMRSRIGMFRLVFPALLILVPTLRNSTQARQTNTHVVWQIGEFDQSSQELGQNFDPESSGFNPVFTVGQSKNSAWPAFQLCTVNAVGGKHSSPYTIVFDLSSPPEGTYTLVISVLLNRPSVPNLLVEINGRKGLYYFDRKISYYAGDNGVDSPIYGGDEIEIRIPASAFYKGQNKLVLTAVEDSENVEAGSMLLYDALRLTQGPLVQPKATAAVKPTVFYKQVQNQMYEVTTVTVTLAEKLHTGDVDLLVGGKHFRSALATTNEFGQQRFQYEIPEFGGQITANVAIRANGKSYHSKITIAPERKWTIYFVPHAHLDIGYTDYQAKVDEVQSRNIDKLLVYLPPNPNMRFSLDGSWVVQNYLATRNEQVRKDFLQLARDGRIGIPAQYANLLTGYASLEELTRSLSYSHSLHRSDGIPFEYANITDVPSVTWSYPSILSAAGLRYFAEATNSDRGPIVLYGKWNERSPFWREGPDGSKVLMANTRQYSQLWFVCDLPPEIGNCRQGLPAYLQQFESPDYKPDAVLMFGSQLENTDVRLREADFIARWNALYTFPKIRISVFPDYFRYIEQNFGPQLATVTGDGGPYWEDGVGSDAANTARDRNNQSRAVSAEELSTISIFLNPTLAAPRQLIDRMWTNLLLYAEHTWGSWDSVYRPDSEEAVRQLATKDHYVSESQQAVSALAEESLSQIADQVQMPAKSLVVFNTLNWPRSGLVELDLDRGTLLTEYPSKVPATLETLHEGAGYRHVRVLAKDVPAMGFKCYSLQEAHSSEASGEPSTKEAPPPQPDSMENAFYRIQVDPASGAVRSILDKQLNRELVDLGSPYRFNQYLYVEGGGKPATQIVYMRQSLPIAQLTITPSSGGRVVGWRTTPFGQILTVEAKDVNTPSVRSEIILFNDEKKIEFVNHVNKASVREKEAVYFAFPVAAPKSSFTYEIQNGWVDPSRDMLKGAGLEWFSVGHWVKASAGDWELAIVPVDTPLLTLGDINRGVWPQKFDPKSSTIFSYVFNNYWHTNYRAEQGGEATFRYVMKSGPSLSPEELARFGRAAMTPLETGQILDNDKVGNPDRPLEPGPLSFLQLDASDVVVENWKTAEDNNGTILRLLETGGHESKARLTFPLFSVKRAWISNAVEQDQEEIAVTESSLEVSLKPHQIVTIRIVAQLKPRQ
jgi:alpha-mannosidase